MEMFGRVGLVEIPVLIAPDQKVWMDKMIKELELRGSGLNLNELDVRETSGDWTRTTFTNVDLDRRYTPAEQAKLFTLPGK